MTNINNILTLEKNKENLIIVDKFLNETEDKDLDYLKVLICKASFLISLETPSEGISLLEDFFMKQTLSTGLSIFLVEAIIDISIDANMYKKALEYINIKLEYLDVFNKKSYYYDLIKLYEKTRNFPLLKKNILIYLQEDIKEDIRYDLTKEISLLDIKENRFNEFAKNKKYLIDYASTHALTNDLIVFYINDLKFLRISSKFDDLIVNAKVYLSYNFISKDNSLLIASILLDAYVNKNMLKEAILLESEYYDYLSYSDKKISLEYAEVALSLYKKLDNSISILDYNSLIKRLSREINPVEVDKSPLEVEYKPKNVKKYAKKSKVTTPRKNYRKNYIDLDLPSIFKVIDAANKKVLQLKFDTKFREVFRIMMMNIEASLNLNEVVILLIDGTCYHYKVGRVYDKTIDIENIKDSFNYRSIKENISIISKDLYEKDLDIIKNSQYDKELNAITFPIKLKDISGSVSYLSKNELFETNTYSILEYITELLSVYLTRDIVNLSVENNLSNLSFLEKKGEVYIKYLSDSKLYFNDSISTKLNIPNETNLLDFYSKINNFSEYKKDLEAFFDNNLDKTTLFFEANELKFKEIIFKKSEINNSYVSLLIDITDYSNKIRNLKKVASLTTKANIYNSGKLDSDIKEKINSGYLVSSLLRVVDLDFYENIYGFKFRHDLTILIGKYLKEIVLEYMNINLYLIDETHYILLLSDVKDIRSAKNKVLSIINKLENMLKEKERRIDIKLDASLYRFKKQSTYKNFNKYLMYLSKTLLANEDKIKIFNKKEYEKIFFKEQLTTHISECLDQNLLKINYNYVLDMEEKKVPYYLANLNLINYNANKSDIDEVIQKRNLLLKVDMYLVHNILDEIYQLYKKTKKYIKVIMDVHKSSLLNHNLMTFINNEFVNKKLPKKVLILNIIDDIKDNTNYTQSLNNDGILTSTSNIRNILESNANIFIYDIKDFNCDFLDEYINLNKKLNTKFIINNITTKEEFRDFKNNQVYLSGDYFNDNIDLQDIIKKINSNK